MSGACALRSPDQLRLLDAGDYNEKAILLFMSPQHHGMDPALHELLRLHQTGEQVIRLCTLLG